RDGLRARRRQHRVLPARGQDPRDGAARADLRVPARAAHADVPARRARVRQARSGAGSARSELGGMSFLEDGTKALEWAAGYRERVGDLPVLADVEPGDVRALLPASAPE